MCALLKPRIWSRSVQQLAAYSSHLSAMEKHKVVPDVIPSVPKDRLTVLYGQIRLEPGAILTPKQVQYPPDVAWNCERDAMYTLLMTDPDAPSRSEPKMREWHHWLVGNIKRNHVGGGDTLSQYIGAAPPKGTSYHRYVLLVFRQPCKFIFDEERLKNSSAEGRAHFSTVDFVKKYRLGTPVAGNFFRAEWDDVVPAINKRLGM